VGVIVRLEAETLDEGGPLRPLHVCHSVLLPPKGSGTERGPNMVANSRAVKRLKREQGAGSPKGVPDGPGEQEAWQATVRR
jgi:hypothetical protein